jgi:O-antigen/teichoic acid export membrane protein
VAVAALLGWWVGPEVVRAVFGDTVEVGAGPASLVASGCALALVNVVMMVGGLAQDRPARVAGAWAVALLAGGVALLALGAAAPLDRVVVAFLVAEVAATVALAVVASAVLRTGRRAGRDARA